MVQNGFHLELTESDFYLHLCTVGSKTLVKTLWNRGYRVLLLCNTASTLLLQQN